MGLEDDLLAVCAPGYCDIGEESTEGQVSVLAVGSWNGDGDTGAAFLYDANDWQFLVELAVPDLQAGDRFGWSVSSDQASVVVGAPGRRVDGTGSAGIAYLFELVEGSWVNTSSFAAGAPEEGDQLATEVAASGGRLLAGAMFDAPTLICAAVGNSNRHRWARSPPGSTR